MIGKYAIVTWIPMDPYGFSSCTSPLHAWEKLAGPLRSHLRSGISSLPRMQPWDGGDPSQYGNRWVFPRSGIWFPMVEIYGIEWFFGISSETTTCNLFVHRLSTEAAPNPSVSWRRANLAEGFAVSTCFCLDPPDLSPKRRARKTSPDSIRFYSCVCVVCTSISLCSLSLYTGSQG